MLHLLRTLWTDERGSVSADWAFVASILVLGAITGAMLLRPPLPTEAEELIRHAPPIEAGR
jgi:hypothetical protein